MGKEDKVAEELARRYRTNCPFTIAKIRGIKVIFRDLGSSTWGIYYSKFRQRYIVINTRLSEELQRAVCAHELGHDVLHRGINRFFVDDHTLFLSAKHERQANTFAVHLLTSQDKIESGEPLSYFFQRLSIPLDMMKYYKISS